MDLLLNVSQQTLAHRVARLVAQRDFPWCPDGLAAGGAIEVGPHRNLVGPGLCALLDVRLPPAEAAAWVASEPILSRHVQVMSVGLVWF